MVRRALGSVRRISPERNAAVLPRPRMRWRRFARPPALARNQLSRWRERHQRSVELPRQIRDERDRSGDLRKGAPALYPAVHALAIQARHRCPARKRVGQGEGDGRYHRPAELPMRWWLLAALALAGCSAPTEPKP